MIAVKIIRAIGVTVMMVFFAAGSFAQKDTRLPGSFDPGYTYTNALGLRAGMTSGITYKHFFGQSGNAMEAILGIWPDALGITGLYEHHTMTDVDGLNWYYGGGAHATMGNSRNFYAYDNGRKFLYRYSEANYAVGVDGIIGIEYKVRQIPFAFSFDLKPYLEIDNIGDAYMFIDPALGIKVAF
jgi:hypothetical protein